VPVGFLGFIYREIREGIDSIFERLFGLLDCAGQRSPMRRLPKPLEITGGAKVIFDPVSARLRSPARPSCRRGPAHDRRSIPLAMWGPGGLRASPPLARLLFRFYEFAVSAIRIGTGRIFAVTQGQPASGHRVSAANTRAVNDTIGLQHRLT